jgi:hypothetical protein
MLFLTDFLLNQLNLSRFSAFFDSFSSSPAQPVKIPRFSWQLFHFSCPTCKDPTLFLAAFPLFLPNLLRFHAYLDSFSAYPTQPVKINC